MSLVRAALVAQHPTELIHCCNEAQYSAVRLLLARDVDVYVPDLGCALHDGHELVEAFVTDRIAWDLTPFHQVLDDAHVLGQLPVAWAVVVAHVAPARDLELVHCQPAIGRLAEVVAQRRKNIAVLLVVQCEQDVFNSLSSLSCSPYTPWQFLLLVFLVRQAQNIGFAPVLVEL